MQSFSRAHPESPRDCRRLQLLRGSSHSRLSAVRFCGGERSNVQQNRPIRADACDGASRSLFQPVENPLVHVAPGGVASRREFLTANLQHLRGRGRFDSAAPCDFVRERKQGGLERAD